MMRQRQQSQGACQWPTCPNCRCQLIPLPPGEALPEVQFRRPKRSWVAVIIWTLFWVVVVAFLLTLLWGNITANDVEDMRRYGV